MLTHKKNLSLPLLALFGLPLAAFGNGIMTTPSSSYTPKIYLLGNTGENIQGNLDILAPVYLSPESALFLYGQGNISSHNEKRELKNSTPWTLTAGFGARSTFGSDKLFGIYALADYMQNIDAKNYWGVNPGLELFTNNWDIRANGYFPINKKKCTTQGFASDFGIDTYVRFAGHNVFDRLADQTLTEKSARGGDLEIGRKLFKINGVLVKGFVGGYTFDMQDEKDITGGSLRLTIQPSSYLTFSIKNTYDAVRKNTLLFGLRVKLNDLGAQNEEKKVMDDQDVRVRLLDPITRNIGNSGLGNSTPLAKKKSIFIGEEAIAKDHVWFFKAGAQNYADSNNPNPGTYENPIAEPITNGDNLINMINNNEEGKGYVNLYFDNGVYSLNGFPNSRIQLAAATNIYGRKDNFLKAADNSSPVVFLGGLDIAAGAGGNNIIDSITLLNDGTQKYGIVIGDITQQNTSYLHNITLNNVTIGGNDTNSFAVGLNISNSSVKIDHNDINAIDIDPSAPSYAKGIVLIKSNLEIGSNNKISAKAQAGISTTLANAEAYGIFAESSNVVFQGNNNTIISQASGGTSSPFGADADASAHSSGIWLDWSSLDMKSDFNTIDSSAYGGKAIATNDFTATTYASQDAITAINPTRLTISGNNNKLNYDSSSIAQGGESISDSGISDASATALGINSLYLSTSLQPEQTLLSGNNNSLRGISKGGIATSNTGSIDVDATAFGISLRNDAAPYILPSSFAMNCNNCTLTAEAYGGTAKAQGAAFSVSSSASAWGLYGNDQNTIEISGSDNSFTSYAQGGSSTGKLLAANTEVFAMANASGIEITNSSLIIGSSSATPRMKIDSQAISGQTSVSAQSPNTTATADGIYSFANVSGNYLDIKSYDEIVINLKSNNILDGLSVFGNELRLHGTPVETDLLTPVLTALRFSISGPPVWGSSNYSINYNGSVLPW